MTRQIIVPVPAPDPEREPVAVGPVRALADPFSCASLQPDVAFRLASFSVEPQKH